MNEQKMNEQKMIRQGDVLLIPADTIPEHAQPLAASGGRLILAHGEVTGHHHSVLASASTSLLATPNNEMWLLIQEGNMLLEHQEHAAIPLETGLYRVVRQREWDGTRQNEWRPVSD